MQTVDFRSDTVTRPTPAMREAMARAPVGDDAYGDDPTVAELETRVADLLGKDAALFVPSGTMANQLAVALHASRGEVLAAHPGAHVQIHEDASAAAIAGVQIMPVGSRLGFFAHELEALRVEESCGWPQIGLVWLENTLGDAGGRPWPLDIADAGADALTTISGWARDHGRAVHLDGARLWHAAALGADLRAMAATADTVSVALSKGLGAPAGSLLCGPRALLARARRLRHGLGGGMRQAGVLAAAGLYALEHHRERLLEDHARALHMARALADLPCWSIATPPTNMVLARVHTDWGPAERICAALREVGVLCHPNRNAEVRFVLHLGVDDEALAWAIDRIEAVVSALGPHMTMG